MREDLIERLGRGACAIPIRTELDAQTVALLREAAAALEAAREDAEFFRWLAVHPNLYTVCDLLRADQYVTLRRACESLAAIDQARGKGVADA